MWEYAWYIIIGFIAGVLDYSAGVGFGLVASVLLVSMGGVDPRIAASVTSLSQIVNAIPASLGHYRKGNLKISRHYLNISALIIVSSSIGALMAIMFYRSLPENLVKVLFTITIISISALSWLSYSSKYRAEPKPKRGRIIAFIGGFIAGVEKAISGGGFSVVLVLIQKAAGIDIRSAIAGLPLVKLIPFSIISISYISSGFFNLGMFIPLALGGLASTLISPRILRRIDERIALAIVTLLAVATVLSVLILPLIR